MKNSTFACFTRALVLSVHFAALLFIADPRIVSTHLIWDNQEMNAETQSYIKQFKQPRRLRQIEHHSKTNIFDDYLA